MRAFRFVGPILLTARYSTFIYFQSYDLLEMGSCEAVLQDFFMDNNILFWIWPATTPFIRGSYLAGVTGLFQHDKWCIANYEDLNVACLIITVRRPSLLASDFSCPANTAAPAHLPLVLPRPIPPFCT